MRISARIGSQDSKVHTCMATNGHERDLDLPAKASGTGSAVSGGELLDLALAICSCNDIHREAAKHDLVLHSVEVVVDGLFGADGEPARDVTGRARVTTEAFGDEVRDLLRRADRLAKVQASLRAGVDVTLGEIAAVSAAAGTAPGPAGQEDPEPLARVIPMG